MVHSFLNEITLHLLLGLVILEVAHDFVPKIKNWLLAQNIQNSFDTWHGNLDILLHILYILLSSQTLKLLMLNWLKLHTITSNILLWSFGRNKRSGKSHERNKQWCTKMGGWEMVCWTVWQTWVYRTVHGCDIISYCNKMWSITLPLWLWHLVRF